MKKKKIMMKTILVIEDERPLLEVINTRLEKDGFGVITARSVDEVFSAGLENTDQETMDITSIEEALDHLRDLEKVDAIWLDHNLIGNENGIDFVKKLRANSGRWREIPIFVISNSEGRETMKSYADLGVSKYYIKSNHRLDEIIKDLNSFLDKNGS